MSSTFPHTRQRATSLGILDVHFVSRQVVVRLVRLLPFHLNALAQGQRGIHGGGAVERNANNVAGLEILSLHSGSLWVKMPGLGIHHSPQPWQRYTFHRCHSHTQPGLGTWMMAFSLPGTL